MLKVSIIVPAYNVESYITSCIESIIHQSYSELQIIIIDDGSIDGTSKKISTFSKQDNRISVIEETNHGVSYARNRGIEKANGAFLTFIDADDYIGIDYIKNLVSAAEKNNADLVISGMSKIDEDGKVKEYIVPDEYKRFKSEEWVARLSSACGHFYRKDYWDRCNFIFDEDPKVRGEDVPLALLYAAECERIFTLPQAEYYYVQHIGSAMNQFKGLVKYRLPYRSLSDVIIKVNREGIQNSKDYYEWFFFRIMATFISITQGANKASCKELIDYIYYMVEQYFPDYGSNPLLRINSITKVPFYQKVSVAYLRHLIKAKHLGQFIDLYCKL